MLAAARSRLPPVWAIKARIQDNGVVGGGGGALCKSRAASWMFWKLKTAQACSSDAVDLVVLGTRLAKSGIVDPKFP